MRSYRRVWEKYREIAAREPERVVLIAGDLCIDEVHEQIVEAVSEKLIAGQLSWAAFLAGRGSRGRSYAVERQRGQEPFDSAQGRLSRHSRPGGRRYEWKPAVEVPSRRRPSQKASESGKSCPATGQLFP